MNKLICFSLVFCWCANFQIGVWVNALNVVSYLSRYGYLPPEYKNSETANLITDESLKSALEDFQTFHGINASGVADDATLKLMNTPRCGVADKVWRNSKSENYVFTGSKWKYTNLTYRIKKYSSRSQLSHGFVDRAMEQVFSTWSRYCALTFRKIDSDGEVDMEILFVIRNHGDGGPFDGRGNVLAHAFFPGGGLGGDAHFDDEEGWTEKSGRVILQAVALHEFGHAFGLAHTSVTTAMMYAYYHATTWPLGLHVDDIAGIQALYGPPGGKGPVIRTPPPPRYGICNLNMTDYTLLTDSDGSTYFFKGTYYWKLSGNGISNDYPKLVNETWKGLDGYIDAAFAYKGITYFFQGSMCYAFKRSTRQGGYPKNIMIKFYNFPSDVDSALVFKNKVYVFRGDRYWGYPISFWSRYFGKSYPKVIKSKWGKDVPVPADAAIAYSNGRKYFFKGNQYWRYNGRKRNIDYVITNPYPRDFKKYWLSC